VDVGSPRTPACRGAGGGRTLPRSLAGRPPTAFRRLPRQSHRGWSIRICRSV
jgi:hypothetical protein